MTALVARLLTRPTTPPPGAPQRRRWQRQQDRHAELVTAVRKAEADRLAVSGRYRRSGAA